MCAAHKTAARDQPPSDLLPVFGVEMSGQFWRAISRVSFVAQDYAIDVHFIMQLPAPTGTNARIMVADDPVPIIAGGQLSQQRCGLRLQPCFTPIVMKIVTQAINGVRITAARQSRQFFQRGPAVIGRQKLTSHRIARCFFKMQISDQQRLPLRPEKGSLPRQCKFLSAKGDHCCHCSPYVRPRSG